LFADFNIIYTEKKDKNFCLLEFILLPFLKLRTAATSTEMDGIAYHLRRNA